MRSVLILLLCALVSLGACTNQATKVSTKPTWMSKAEVAALDQVGDKVSPPDSALPKVSASHAILTGKANGPFSDSAPATAYLVMYTSGSCKPNGKGTCVPLFDHRLAWAVTFTGLKMPRFGGPMTGSSPSPLGTYPANEVVFIDASTGSYMDSVSMAANCASLWC